MTEARTIPLPDSRRLSDDEALEAARGFQALMQLRRTVRDFDARPVPREVIEACIGDFCCKQPNSANGVVIAWDDVIDFIRIAIGINNCYNRYSQFSSFLNGYVFLFGIHDKDGCGRSTHVPYSRQVLVQFVILPAQIDQFFLGEVSLFRIFQN